MQPKPFKGEQNPLVYSLNRLILAMIFTSSFLFESCKKTASVNFASSEARDGESADASISQKNFPQMSKHLLLNVALSLLYPKPQTLEEEHTFFKLRVFPISFWSQTIAHLKFDPGRYKTPIQCPLIPIFKSPANI